MGDKNLPEIWFQNTRMHTKSPSSEYHTIKLNYVMGVWHCTFFSITNVDEVLLRVIAKNHTLRLRWYLKLYVFLIVLHTCMSFQIPLSKKLYALHTATSGKGGKGGKFLCRPEHATLHVTLFFVVLYFKKSNWKSVTASRGVWTIVKSKCLASLVNF